MASNDDSLPGFPKKVDGEKIENALVNYVPVIGAAGYFAFLSNLALANSLLFASHLGIGMYLYNSKHLKNCPKPADRVLYSLLGTTMFNFGSILICATSRIVLPDEPYTRFATAALLASTFLYFGRKYVLFLDGERDS